MKPTHYIELTAIGGSPIEVITRLMALIHGIARKHKLKYALAFPKIRVGQRPHTGNVVQVFGEPKELGAMETVLAENDFIKDYVRLQSTTIVPDDISTWTRYRLFRIPNRKSRTTQTRANRIQGAERLPYLKVASQSNGHAFSVRILPEKNAEESDVWEPNGYGLAVTTRLFSLPDIRPS